MGMRRTPATTSGLAGCIGDLRGGLSRSPRLEVLRIAHTAVPIAPRGPARCHGRVFVSARALLSPVPRWLHAARSGAGSHLIGDTGRAFAPAAVVSVGVRVPGGALVLRKVLRENGVALTHV